MHDDVAALGTFQTLELWLHDAREVMKYTCRLNNAFENVDIRKLKKYVNPHVNLYKKILRVHLNLY